MGRLAVTPVADTCLEIESFGIGFNGNGQIALPVRFTGDKVDTLLLLTPVSP